MAGAPVTRWSETMAAVHSCAGIVLAGGRSSRMGSSKAALAWHDSTLLRRVTGIVARCVDGPVVVVRAPGQPLPPLDPAVEVVQDAREHRGPLEGLAAGLQAVAGRAAVAYVSSTDLPLLHPAFVRCVVGALHDQVDVVLPEVGGYRQPLAAAYRIGVLATLQILIDADRLRPAFLFERCRVLRLDGGMLAADPGVAALDPALRSLCNINEPDDYWRAHTLPGPKITVQRLGGRAAEIRAGHVTVTAWTLGELATAVGLRLDERIVARLNGDQISGDRQLPLAAGDVVAFSDAQDRPCTQPVRIH